MPRYLTGPLLAALAALGACATDSMRSKQTLLEETLRAYAATIRWGEIAQAQAFLDPMELPAHPPPALAHERFRQVKVSGYDEQPAVPTGENEVRQVVQIDLVNVNTQAARSIVDRQVWRYDEEARRWWLVSGLPDISRRD
jgi:hypothetical protein